MNKDYMRNEETILEEWKMGRTIPVQEEGDKNPCKNYRTITLLNKAYKILFSVIQERLANVPSLIVEYQYGPYEMSINS